MSLLGGSIRRARLDAQLSVNDLAACLDADPGRLASWEEDLETPLRENLLRLCLQFPDLLHMLEYGNSDNSNGAGLALGATRSTGWPL